MARKARRKTPRRRTPRRRTTRRRAPTYRRRRRGGLRKGSKCVRYGKTTRGRFRGRRVCKKFSTGRKKRRR